MTLRLHAAAHYAECFPRLPIFHHESWNNGVKRTFTRRINVRVRRLHRKKFATILKHKPEPRHDDPAAHPAIIALNQRHHVTLVVGGAQVNRVALIECRAASLDSFGRTIRLNEFATRRGMFSRNYSGERKCRE